MDTIVDVGRSRSGGLSRRPPRRQWAKELKVEIVAESYVPGASIAEVARRHGINANPSSPGGALWNVTLRCETPSAGEGLAIVQ